jgi:hypothetical protein
MGFSGRAPLLCFVGIILAAGLATPSFSGEWEERVAYWEKEAFYCPDKGPKFPSKERKPDKDPSRCNDGDMTFFNGLLCASGDDRGCRAVMQAQAGDGRWWRSPRRIGMDSSGGHDVSFSPDQALGVMHYVYQKRQQGPGAFDRWLTWIDTNRPCVFPSCLGKIKGWPRYCDDDAKDKRCTLRPTDCGLLEYLGPSVRSTKGGICKKVLEEFGINTEFEYERSEGKDFFIPLDTLAVGAAVLNDSGFPLHLVGVRIWLLERMGHASQSTRLAASILSFREPRNPFFLYLVTGKSQKVRDLVMKLCPSPDSPSRERSQWAWERTDSAEAWKDSMYWDCIFMANLLR